ncbi:hypothetical protein BBF96_09360 [Anoxybacter fermentans]|uniref:Uncharacterized protein n=1 Tax=Anoxybacter fermentans TaxID=1323375 RepID=A0A3Q9HRB7_9FIRM|nr:hypothetical protein BBF96_09360 [Anoxybacter fermentans]
MSKTSLKKSIRTIVLLYHTFLLVSIELVYFAYFLILRKLIRGRNIKVKDRNKIILVVETQNELNAKKGRGS